MAGFFQGQGMDESQDAFIKANLPGGHHRCSRELHATLLLITDGPSDPVLDPSDYLSLSITLSEYQVAASSSLLFAA